MSNQISICIFRIITVVGFLFAGNAHAFTCPDSSNPVVVSADCTQMVINADKTSVTVNSGVTVSDVFPISSYGPVSLVYGVAGNQVGTFTNNGNIRVDYSGANAFQISNGSGITALINNGLISTDGNSSISSMQVRGSIGALTNSGTISANGSATAISVQQGGYVGSIVNGVSGRITASGAAGQGVHITGDPTFLTPTSIGSITNLGLIQGGVKDILVENAGALTTLNSLQDGLRYVGTLPTNYNVIIHSTANYGKTTFSGVGGGPMTFGIGAGSTISRSNTYADVLSGITLADLVNTSGTLGGGIVATPWTLTNTSGNDWSLTTTLGSPVAPTVDRSRAASSQAKAITDAYSIAFTSGSSQLLANGTSFVSAVQGLTTTQVNQLINVHAEGYSSNMTIGLEQMAHITNTVMDRIHAPMSSSPTTKVYQDDEGRYVWADAAAVKGTVNNYNNLAGFGYNLYDLIIGGDIKRTKDGGYGVFAGTGTTSMTESQQVTQNFNTTNFYAGLYGAHNFTEQVKLSGALGYMYGNTNANRNTPSVGQFTGGNATSSYKTNGVYGAAKLAKAYQFSDVTVSPFVGASYSQLWMGGAAEQGGNDFNFGINSATAYTAVTFAGADFVFPLLKGVNNPLSLIGFYKFGYDWYANSNSAHSITATSPTYGSFTQVGANMGPVSNMFGLGIQGGISKDVSARIGVVASTNSYGQEYGGGAELRVKF